MSSIDIQICSAALVRVGSKPIDTLTGAAATNTACRTLYPRIVEDRLAGYRWRFAAKQVQLERLNVAPLAGYDSAYQLPANTETVLSLTSNGYPVRYDRFGTEIHCNAQESDVLIAEVQVHPPEAEWPRYFRALIELDLAAALSVSIAEDTQKATYYEGKSLRQYSQARTLDSQARTARKIDLGGLRRYHRGAA